MELAISLDLLKLLARAIAARDGARLGRPSSQEAHGRAKHVAELEAIRELKISGSIEAALLVGLAAFDREMRYFNPVSLLHQADEASAEGAEVLDEAISSEG